jgi:hypothetical protein
MEHEIHKVVAFEVVAPFTLRLEFEDGVHRVVDFSAVLKGELYGPLQDLRTFEQVSLDKEAHTIVWPNGADFDPAVLYNWQTTGPELAKLAERWSPVNA